MPLFFFLTQISNSGQRTEMIQTYTIGRFCLSLTNETFQARSTSVGSRTNSNTKRWGQLLNPKLQTPRSPAMVGHAVETNPFPAARPLCSLLPHIYAPALTAVTGAPGRPRTLLPVSITPASSQRTLRDSPIGV